jgi:hypothetical protein
MDNQSTVSPQQNIYPSQDPYPSPGGTPSRFNRKTITMIIIGITLLTVGFLMGYILQSSQVSNLNKKNSLYANQVSLLTGQINDLKAANKGALTNTTSATHLKITELGINMPLSFPIADLRYTFVSSGGGYGHIHFETDSFIAQAIKDGCLQSKINLSSDEYLGAYSVLPNKSTNPGSQAGQDGTFLAAINGHYLYYQQPQTSCGNGNNSYSLELSQENSIIQSLVDAQSGS